jgi:hypothetical protein
LPQELADGNVYICLDTGEMYTDALFENQLIRVALGGAIAAFDCGNIDLDYENTDITFAILGQGQLGSIILGKSEESNEIKYIKLDGSAKLDGTFKLG